MTLGRARFLSSGALGRMESTEARVPRTPVHGGRTLRVGAGNGLLQGIVSSMPYSPGCNSRSSPGRRWGLTTILKPGSAWSGRTEVSRTACTTGSTAATPRGARSSRSARRTACFTAEWRSGVVRRGVGSGLVGGLGGRKWAHYQSHGLAGIWRITPPRYGHVGRRPRGKTALVAGWQPSGGAAGRIMRARSRAAVESSGACRGR